MASSPSALRQSRAGRPAQRAPSLPMIVRMQNVAKQLKGWHEDKEACCRAAPRLPYELDCWHGANGT